MENLLTLNFLTVAIAVSAFVYTNMLTDTGMILHNLNNRLDSLIVGKYRWLYTILIGCQFCVAGQWALWYYLYFIFFKIHGCYELEIHIWFIMQTIFITKVVTFVYYAMHKPANKPEAPASLPTIKTAK